MDWKSYEDGRLGLGVGPNTDMDSYMEGKRARESKTAVPGVAFTLLIVAPFLFLVYPALGLTIYAIFLAVVYLLFLAGLSGGLNILFGVILGIAGFFPAYKLEAIVSQFAPYRFFRVVLRPIAVFCLTVALRSGAAFDNNHAIDFNRVAGDKLLEGILAAILMHFILRRADRLYFPVLAQVRRQQERAAKGIPDQRPLLKRFWYSLFWIIPVVAILNLMIRLIVGEVTEGPQERAAFYQQYSMFVYILDFIVWFTLAFTGILPGTAKIRKYVVGQTVES